MGRHIVCGFFLAFFVACASVTVVPLGDGKSYPKRTSPDKVQVLVEKPDTTFIEIALVDYSGTALQGKGAPINGLKEKASKLGGDAIILSGWGEAEGSLGTKPVARAVIIRFIP
ncbi:MAG: hypothetical protein L0196_10320 [candidate division Zixibacteria bacterium]|nr:hypothetical protein [candidate division Zixibacteria bacterium]